MNLPFIYLVCGLALGLQACSVKASKQEHIERQNSQINQATRREMQIISEQFIRQLGKGDTTAAKKMMAQQLVDNLDRFPALSAAFARDFTGLLTLLEEVEVLSDGKEAVHNIQYDSELLGKYNFKYYIANKQMYFAQYSFGNDQKQFLVLLGFGREDKDSQWKLFRFFYGPYSYYHKNAGSYFNMAQQYKHNKDTMQELLNAFAAQALLSPIGEALELANQEIIYKHYQSAVNAFVQKYPTDYPFQLKEIPSKPMIYAFTFSPNEQSVRLKVSLVSKKFDDEAGLQKELEDITAVLKTKFPGITGGQTEVVYSVCDKDYVNNAGFRSKEMIIKVI
ncbi:hypothetical protein LX64_04576 [Chitinophaga skermanii]|uniref:Uncharacterized protein n=1 Tax=Chitinophaga skermanii TaxID=331697 RepID=A0A327Q867_9BACT|nr:hypothetical protein [Chitinophaga skermanii]RAI99442.1 hypothetical protein LX64_04576 [Chitinophaga skermanii]